MSLRGVRVGYSHTWYAQEGDRLVTQEHEEMSMQRMGSTMKSVSDEAFYESPTGQPLAFRYESRAGSHEVVNGTITAGKVQAEVRRGGQMSERKFDLDPEVKFPIAGDREIKAMTPAAGLKFSQKHLALSSLTVQTSDYEVVGRQPIDGQEYWKLKVTTRGTGGFEQIVYVDDHWETRRLEFSGLPMQGNRATKEQALAGGTTAAQPSEDVLAASGLPCDVLLLKPRSTTEMAIRVKAKSGTLQDFSFAGDSQTVETSSPGEVVVRVKPPVMAGEASNDVDPEYLEPNDFLHCKDPKIVDTAKRVAGSSTGAEAVAKLRNWVATKVVAGGEVAFATDLEALQSGRGDCTERAVLLASLCRAVGIPSKVIYGFAYSHGLFIGHAWTEVRLGSNWIPVDAALLKNDADRQIDAGHLKMAETSLKDGNPDSRGMMGAFGRLDTSIVDFTPAGGNLTSGSGLQTQTTGRSWKFPGLGLQFTVPAGWTLTPAAAGSDMQLRGPDSAEITVSCMEKGRDFLQSERTMFARGEPTRVGGLSGRKFLRGDKLLLVLDRGTSAVVVIGQHLTTKAVQDVLKMLADAKYWEP